MRDGPGCPQKIRQRSGPSAASRSARHCLRMSGRAYPQLSTPLPVVRSSILSQRATGLRLGHRQSRIPSRHNGYRTPPVEKRSMSPTDPEPQTVIHIRSAKYGDRRPAAQRPSLPETTPKLHRTPYVPTKRTLIEQPSALVLTGQRLGRLDVQPHEDELAASKSAEQHEHHPGGCPGGWLVGDDGIGPGDAGPADAHAMQQVNQRATPAVRSAFRKNRREQSPHLSRVEKCDGFVRGEILEHGAFARPGQTGQYDQRMSRCLHRRHSLRGPLIPRLAFS